MNIMLHVSNIAIKKLEIKKKCEIISKESASIYFFHKFHHVTY